MSLASRPSIPNKITIDNSIESEEYSLYDQKRGSQLQEQQNNIEARTAGLSKVTMDQALAQEKSIKEEVMGEIEA